MSSDEYETAQESGIEELDDLVTSLTGLLQQPDTQSEVILHEEDSTSTESDDYQAPIEGRYSSTEPDIWPEPDYHNQEESMDFTDIDFEGETFKVLTTPNIVTKTLRTVYKKKDRSSLTPDKFNDFWAKAIRFQQTEKFAPIPLTISTSEDLDKTYNLQMGVQEFETTCHHYDMNDIFTIIKWDSQNGRPIKVGDLFRDYTNLTIEQVSESNEFYNTHLDHSAMPWIPENMNMTQNYLLNNTETELYRKCLEVFNTYSPAQQGGPLMFKILMDHLEASSVVAAQVLSQAIQNIDIKNYDGEDVSKVVSQVRGVLLRLRAMERKDASGNVIPGQQIVPPNISQILMNTFKSTSDEEFNRTFQLLSTSAGVERHRKGWAAYGTPEEILNMAEFQYRERLASKDGWHGQSNTTSVFKTERMKSSDQTCFNCGQKGHGVSDCTKPKNEEKIKENRGRYFELRTKSQTTETGSGRSGRGRGRGGRFRGGRSTGRGRGHDWSDPRPEERHRRMIKNKPHIWNPQTKRWLQDTTGLLAQIPGRIVTSSSPSTGENTSTATSTQQIQLAAANAERGLSLAMAGFRSAMQNLD